MTKKVTNTTIWNISNKRIKRKRPRHGILHRLVELIHFEMLVSDTLLIDAYALNGQHAIFLRQPSRIQLVVWYNPEKDQADTYGEKARDQKDDLPWRNGRSVLVGSLCDAVSYRAADDLAEAVEAEP